MVRELAPAPPSKAPWIPDPPLVFAQPGLQFMPVPEHTAYAAYWERDPERSTPYPCPCDVLLGASAIVQKVHASIPGMWLQETDKSFSVMVKPTFVPPGLPRYTELYDKTMATEPSWPMRRDLRLGSTRGQIYMTTEGLLILRARSKCVCANAMQTLSTQTNSLPAACKHTAVLEQTWIWRWTQSTHQASQALISCYVLLVCKLVWANMSNAGART